MKTTLRIDDDLLRELKQHAHRENVSMAQLVNRVIRRGLETPLVKRRRFRQKTADMGKPLVNLD